MAYLCCSALTIKTTNDHVALHEAAQSKVFLKDITLFVVSHDNMLFHVFNVTCSQAV